MTEDFVSIIVPIYNTEKYVDRSLNSIAHQSYEKLLSICVDDGTQDFASTIADDYALIDNRYISVHQKNGGPSKARNTGLDLHEKIGGGGSHF